MAFAKLTLSVGIPWIPALLLSGLVVVPIGAVLANPAIRLSGLFLALSRPLGSGLLLQNMFHNSELLDVPARIVPASSVPTPSLSWLHSSTPTGVYYVVLLVVVICVAAIMACTSARIREVSLEPSMTARPGFSYWWHQRQCKLS